MVIEYIEKTKKNKKISYLKKYSKDCIINVYNPDNEEIEFLINKFDIGKGEIEDSLDDNELPRVDFEKNKTYIYLRNIGIETSHPVLFVILKNNILILSKYKLNFIEKIFDLNEKIYTNHKLRILISLLDIFSQNLEKVVKQILKLVSKKRNLEYNFNQKDMAIFLKYEDTINHIVSVYNYIDNVYLRILKKINFHKEDKEILENLIVDLEEGLFICENSKKTITSMRDLYSIEITNKLNNSIKILTSFTIFINIPTVIFSFYGMNIKLPYQELNIVFLPILILVFVLIFLFFLFLKNRKIL